MNTLPNQIPLFEEIARERMGREPRPAHRDNESSREAADYIQPFTASLRTRVLLELSKRGERGATADELCIALDARRNSIAPRLCELGPGTKKNPGMKLIHTNGERRAVAGQNVKADVWVVNSRDQ